MAKAKSPTVSRGVRLPAEVDVWLKRAAAKRGVTVNALAGEIISQAFDGRHAK